MRQVSACLGRAGKHPANPAPHPTCCSCARRGERAWLVSSPAAGSPKPWSLPPHHPPPTHLHHVVAILVAHAAQRVLRQLLTYGLARLLGQHLQHQQARAARGLSGGSSRHMTAGLRSTAVQGRTNRAAHHRTAGAGAKCATPCGPPPTSSAFCTTRQPYTCEAAAASGWGVQSGKGRSTGAVGLQCSTGKPAQVLHQQAIGPTSTQTGFGSHTPPAATAAAPFRGWPLPPRPAPRAHRAPGSAAPLHTRDSKV